MKLLSKLLTLTVIFTIGLSAGLLLASAQNNEWEETPDALLDVFTPFTVQDQPSPRDRILEKQIEVYADRIILDIQDAQWATFADTKSMEPILYKGANAIELVPESSDDVQEGDICSYKSEYAEGDIIHRVVTKSADEQGTYFIFKGDNLQTSDPGKIRFDQIQRCVVAIIY